MATPGESFYEDDEPLADVVEAYQRGRKFRTRRPRGMRLDSLAHVLYCPTMRGERVAVARWHHRIHLIPGWLFRFVCDRFEASLWRGFPADDWCPHVTYSSLPSLTCGCGRPIPDISTGTSWAA